MTWDRWDISQHNIFYEEDIQPTGIPTAPYPSHVEDLRNSMLDFSCPKLGYRDEEETLTLYQKKATDPALIPAEHIQNKANHYESGEYAEKIWESFFRKQFFDPLEKSVSVSRENSRRTSRCNYFYDAFEMDSNRVWDTFSDNVDDDGELSRYEKKKCPKPDCAFHLPLYHLEAQPGIPKVEDSKAQQWNQSSETTLMETFSWSVHKRLYEYGLRSTPIRAFRHEPKNARLISYPWLIVEHKKENVTRAEETVTCQAANGSACAIQLNKIAARYALELDDNAEIPPIPTITTIGKDVKVWITYFSKRFWARCSERYRYNLKWKKCREGYIMRAVWSGDMTKIEDITQFQLILDNTHTWAMRVYKPLMSSYIRHWIQVHCYSGGTLAPDALLRRQQMIERCQSLVPMVRGVLEKHSSFELDLDYSERSTVTPLLLSLIVKEVVNSERQSLANEIDSMITKRLGAIEAGLSEAKCLMRSTCLRQQTEVSQVTEVVHSQETIFSRTTTFDRDDPDDRDYEEPRSNKKSSRIVPQNIDTSGPPQEGAELRRSSRLNPQPASPAHVSDEGSSQPGATDGNTENVETQENEAVQEPKTVSPNLSLIDSSANSNDQSAPTGSTSRFAGPTNSTTVGDLPNREGSSSKDRSSGGLFDSVPPDWYTRGPSSLRPSPGSTRTDWKADPGSISLDFGPSSLPQMDHPKSTSEVTQSSTPQPTDNAQDATSQSKDEQGKSVIPDSQDSTNPSLS